jgi:ribonuclease HI
VKKLQIYIDGASRGNPGPASYGVCIRDEAGRDCLEVNDYIGEATNSVAEYRALLRALEEARKLGGEELLIYTDSQLVARQFEGTYKIRHEGLRSIMTRIRDLEKSFKSVSVKHIPRSSHPGNKRADRLANIAINKAERFA